MTSNIRINKNCQFCNNEFVAKTTVTKFCSDNCAKRAYKLRNRDSKILQAVENASSEKVTSPDNLNTKQYLNINEAAILVGASRWTVHRLIKSGQLTVTKVGTRTIISRKTIDKLFNP